MKKKPESLMELLRRVEPMREELCRIESRLEQNLKTQHRIESAMEPRQRLRRRVESLMATRRRIEKEEGGWRELARIMTLIRALSVISPLEGHPGGMSPWPETIPGTLFRAVIDCTDDLPGALEKAAKYLRDHQKPISKKGGVLTLRLPFQVLAPPVGFAVSVIETTIRLILLKLEASGDEEPLEPTKGEIKAHWKELGWQLSDGQKWDSEKGKRIWPNVFKEIGLDDLRQTPRKPSTEKKRNRKKRSR